MMDKRVTQALEEGSVLDQLVNGLALITESDREKMMRIYQAAMPEELKKMNIVAGKATIEKMAEERAENEEKKRKIRLIDEGVKRKYFPKGSGPGETLNFGAYQGCRFGDVYMKDPSYAKWARTIEKPKGWKIKCFKFFVKRLLDLEQAMQRESEGDERKSVCRDGLGRKESCGGMQGGNWTETSMGGYDGGRGSSAE